MTFCFWILLCLQAITISVDEFYCHWRRTLPRWEKWGHPLDTFFFMLPLGFLAFVPDLSVRIYILLAGFSCFFITKDEWVHSELCTPFENWLHAILFILHPLVLVFAWLAQQQENIKLLPGILLLMGLFLIYQLIYWNLYESHSIRS